MSAVTPTGRIEYAPRTPDEELDIDPVTGKGIIINRPAPSEIEMAIPFVIGALGSVAVIILVLLFLVFFDIFFGQT